MPKSQVTTGVSDIPPAVAYRPPVDRAQVGLLEETIIPSTKSTELRRTPAADYLFRFMSRVPHLAELYHCNSRIAPFSTANTVMSKRPLVDAVEWYYSTAFTPRDGVFDEPLALDAGVIAPIGEIASAAGAAVELIASADSQVVAFPLDFFAWWSHRLYRIVPGKALAWMERSLDIDEEDQLRRALPELEIGLDPAPVVLFLAIAPWRYMLLQGPRGYRRALISLGTVLGQIEEAAARAGDEIAVSLDFFDATVDGILRLDGLETSTAAVLSLRSNGVMRAAHSENDPSHGPDAAREEL
jgi:hypothetical protein